MNVVIFDEDPKKIENAKHVAGDQLECKVVDVRKLKAGELQPNEAIVTAGNSFGIMDGGLDQAFEQVFPGTQAAVQKIIAEQFLGELPVGCAVSVTQPNGALLVYAPTMQVPMQLAYSANSYYATLAVLREIADKNRRINTLFLPLFCCGVGGMSVTMSTEQIMYAVEQAKHMQAVSSLGPPVFDWEYARNVHSRWHKMVGIAE